MRCLWAGMLLCICRDASLRVEMLIITEKMLFIEISKGVWPNLYGAHTSLGRALLVGLVSPLQPGFAVAAVLGGGYLGWDGGLRWIWAGQGEFDVYDIYFCVFFHCCCRGLVSGGGDWALGYISSQIWDFPNVYLFPGILSLKLFGN